MRVLDFQCVRWPDGFRTTDCLVFTRCRCENRLFAVEIRKPTRQDHFGVVRTRPGVWCQDGEDASLSKLHACRIARAPRIHPTTAWLSEPMSSKNRRANARRGVKSRNGGLVDPHAAAVAKDVGRGITLFDEFAAFDAPLEEIDRRISEGLAALEESLAPHRPERVVELARLACLPWSMAGAVKPDTEGGATKAELLALFALVMCVGGEDGSSFDEVPNSLYRAAHDWAESIGDLVGLAQVRSIFTAWGKPAEDLDSLALGARASAVWIRNTSYPDMLKTTHDLLFGQQEVRGALSAHLGFDASDAYAVLTCLHDLQVERMNDRMTEGFEALAEGAQSGETSPDAEIKKRAGAAINRIWQPTADLVAIVADDIAETLECEIDLVEAVLRRFAVDLGTSSSRQVFDGFMRGDNPLRTNPVVRTKAGKYMLVHDALVLPSIRENLEQELKALPDWENYQKWRGRLLEDLGKEAIESIIPGAKTYAFFEYFVPANDAEEGCAPSTYTKKVEGDLLFVIDDVAIIVEAKAAAINPASRAGETRKLRRDLTGIIKHASDQAARVQKRIEDDGGLQVHRSGWLDLAHVREIHIVALSLEDLSGVATATSDLVAAGFLDADRIPWVVSIHDLQVIASLVDRAAEFLLYLRRRRDPEVSLAFVSPDELDLFLYFYEAGLYVAPNPEVLAAELPFLPPARPSDIRRREKLGRALITTRTDPLDAWHYAELDPDLPRVSKPVLTGSPMTPLVDELQSRRDYAWLSIGATLLSGATKAQADMHRIPKKLIAATRHDGREHSHTIPFGNSRGDAWLLVWMSRPPDSPPDIFSRHALAYLRAKKYQLKMSRGAVFTYDSQAKCLDAVIYDGALPTPDPEMDKALVDLFAPDQFAGSPPPQRKARSSTKKRKRKQRRKRR